MVADAGGLYHGGKIPSDWDKGTRRFFGQGVGKIVYEVKRVIKQFEERTTAREVVQYAKGAVETELYPMPQPCKEKAPDEINTYTDGSLKNAKGNHWKIGGLGCGGRT